MIERNNSSIEQFSLPFSKFLLSNGLIVIIHEDHSDPIVAVSVTYKVGAMQDPQGQSGMAHLFEHLMFRGTAHYNSGDHLRLINESGGRANAQTFADKTVFHNLVPAKDLALVLALESDRMKYAGDFLTPEKLRTEIETVLNERKQSIENSTFNKANEIATHFTLPLGHPYRSSVIGLEQDLHNISLVDVKHHFDHWFQPQNAILTIAGDIRTSHVIGLVEKYFRRITNSGRQPTFDQNLDFSRNRQDVSIQSVSAIQPIYMAKMPGVSRFSKEWATLECLSYILGNDKDSYLAVSLNNDTSITNAISYNLSLKNAGEFNIVFFLHSGSSLSLAKSKLFKVLDLLKSESDSFYAVRINQFVHFRRFRTAYEVETIEGRIYQMTDYELHTGRVNYVGEELEMYEKITPSLLRHALDQYLDSNNIFSTTIFPDNKRDTIIFQYSNLVKFHCSNTPSKKLMTDFLENAEINPPFEAKYGGYSLDCLGIKKYKTHSFSNGSRVVYHFSNEVPVINFFVRIRILDFPINNVTRYKTKMISELIRSSDTKNYSNDEMIRLIKDNGVYFNIRSENNDLIFTIKGLKETFPVLLKILKEKIIYSSLRSSSFDSLSAKIEKDLSATDLDPITIANREFHSLLLMHGTNDLLEPPALTTLKDLREIYEKFGSSALFIVSGDIQENELIDGLSLFGTTTYKACFSATTDVHSKPLAQESLSIVHIPRAEQTVVRVGCYISRPGDMSDSIYLLSMANYIFGGHFNSRLNSSLRELHHYTYKAESFVTGHNNYSLFFLEMSVTNDHLKAALLELYSLLKEFITIGVNEAEVSCMKKAWLSKTSTDKESSASIIQWLLTMADSKTIRNLQERQCHLLNTVTANQLNEIIHKLLKGSFFYTLLAGDETIIRSKIEDVSIP